MTEFNRSASAIWYGDSRSGHGTISTESKALSQQKYNYQTRFGEKPGTNPEELLAAAHAACFSMALASVMKKNNLDSHKIETTGICTMISKEDGYVIYRMQLHVRGDVSGIDEAGFRRLVMEADRVCPVSNLLSTGLAIEIEAVLGQPVP